MTSILSQMYNFLTEQLVPSINLNGNFTTLANAIDAGCSTDSSLTGNGRPGNPLHVVSSGGGGALNCVKMNIGTSNINSNTVIPANSIITNMDLIIGEAYATNPINSLDFATFGGGNAALDASGNIYFSYNTIFSVVNNISNAIKMVGLSYLYVLDSSGNIHYSSNNGISFSTIGTISGAISICVNSASGSDHIHVLDNTGKIWSSNYTGGSFSTFTQVGTLSNGISIASARTSMDMSDQIWILDNSGVIHYSNNGGSSFSTMGTVTNAIKITASSQGGMGYYLVALDNSGNIKYSTDNGSTFANSGNIPNAKTIQVLDGGTVYTITSSGGIYSYSIQYGGSYSLYGTLSIIATMNIQVNSTTPFELVGSGGFGHGGQSPPNLNSTGNLNLMSSVGKNIPIVEPGTIGIILNNSPNSGSSTLYIEYISTFQN